MKVKGQIRPGLQRGDREVSRGEKGYTLLLAIFIAALMLIAASAAVPNLITQDRRQMEKLMIWRGQQYARAIGLYYRKTGHFPHDLEELEKGVAGIHFLRQAYKDPMNTEDGSWRLIYLGNGGQLIGSFCWQTLAQYEAAQKGVELPVSMAGRPSVMGAMSDFGTEALGGSRKKAEAVPTCEMLGQGSSSSIHPQTITEGQMVGGNLIGVAGVVNHPSIKHYMGAANYRYWEFIWNPQQGGQRLQPTAAPTNGKGEKKQPAQPGSSPSASPSTSPSSSPAAPTPPSREEQNRQP